MAFWAPLISAGISAAGSALGGYLGRKKETGTDKRKRALIDDLLASVKGEGPYSDMFRANEEAFQKSYVNPAKSIFRNQIAPQIQQSFIQSGQQRGTGLEDTLSRAGVELDEILNSQYLNYMNQGNQNKLGIFNSILGGGQLSQNQSGGSAASQGFAGYLASDASKKDIGDILKAYSNRPKTTATGEKPRTGFEQEQG